MLWILRYLLLNGLVGGLPVGGLDLVPEHLLLGEDVVVLRHRLAHHAQGAAGLQPGQTQAHA